QIEVLEDRDCQSTTTAVGLGFIGPWDFPVPKVDLGTSGSWRVTSYRQGETLQITVVNYDVGCTMTSDGGLNQWCPAYSTTNFTRVVTKDNESITKVDDPNAKGPFLCTVAGYPLSGDYRIIATDYAQCTDVYCEKSGSPLTSTGRANDGVEVDAWGPFF